MLQSGHVERFHLNIPMVSTEEPWSLRSYIINGFRMKNLGNVLNCDPCQNQHSDVVVRL